MRKLLYIAPLILALLGCSKAPTTSVSATDPNATSAATPPAATAEAAPPTAPAAEPLAELPAGTAFQVRIVEALDTARNRAGDRFQATLVSPVEVNGKVVIPRGTRCDGHVTASHPSGRLQGRAYLAVALDSFELNGATYHIRTRAHGRVSSAHKKRNLTLIGGGSGLGALIGGLAGGGKGALIGAGAGAAAGTAGAAATGEKNVRLPAEALLTFRLKSPVELRL